jgi:hypothetical protein
VKRERPPGTHPSRRALLWTCLDCGAEREEPLSGEPEAAPLTAD